MIKINLIGFELQLLFKNPGENRTGEVLLCYVHSEKCPFHLFQKFTERTKNGNWTVTIFFPVPWLENTESFCFSPFIWEKPLF